VGIDAEEFKVIRMGVVAEEMILDLDLLNLLVEGWVFREIDSGVVVTKYTGGGRWCKVDTGEQSA